MRIEAQTEADGGAGPSPAPRTRESGHRTGRAPLRFGLTVGRRHARRAVDRALVKRVVREAVRQRLPLLSAQAAQAGWRVDVVIRLKGPIGSKAAGKSMARAEFKHAVRIEADQLLERLAHFLRGAHMTPGNPGQSQ